LVTSEKRRWLGIKQAVCRFGQWLRRAEIARAEALTRTSEKLAVHPVRFSVSHHAAIAPTLFAETIVVASVMVQGARRD
jgi:hypothetical protein